MNEKKYRNLMRLVIQSGILRTFFIFLTILSSVVCSASEPVAVVASKTFHEALKPWIEHRNKQGYTIFFISEPFENQRTTPDQVKNEIRKLAERESISALLLIGNGIERTPTDAARSIPSPLLPCQIIQNFGDETHLASDDWYADLDGDGFADFPVGRFPVDTPEELERIVRKTIRYETEVQPGTWCRRMQIVAGIGNFSPLADGAIESTAKYALTEIVPNSWDISFLHANWKSPFCPSVWDYQTELSGTLQRDCLFWAYLGHGTHRMLDPLYTPQGFVPSLHADELPEFTGRNSASIALLFCCYGGMPDRETRSLAEEILIRDRGPVAVLAASRTTMPYGMSVFGVELLQELLERQKTTETPTLGRISFEAKRKMLRPSNVAETIQKEKTKTSRRRIQQRPFRDNLEMLARMLDPKPDQLDVQLKEHAALFHLFGDPLLRLPKPFAVDLSCAEKIKPGETLKIQGRCELNEGTVLLELLADSSRISLTSRRRNELRLDAETRRLDNEEYFKANDRVLYRTENSMFDGKFETEIPLPVDSRGLFIIRAFVLSSDGSAFALGSTDVLADRR